MTPEQCRAARGFLDWSQSDLASAAHVSLSTVRDYEKGRRVPIANNLAAMEAALRAKGIALSSDDKTQTVAFAGEGVV
ncbi:helix-turn-helix domain-containing protein [Labrys wisconsinensis]|uniref:helix-turn-helix domain-containing protein n=1 Tax=Labrys wisconsinensis TaxID=425677 RepID=UPI0027D89631|nr:helix-turn-helix transcriptional regulator [Labrys wisconsinensis]